MACCGLWARSTRLALTSRRAARQSFLAPFDVLWRDRTLHARSFVSVRACRGNLRVIAHPRTLRVTARRGLRAHGCICMRPKKACGGAMAHVVHFPSWACPRACPCYWCREGNAAATPWLPPPPSLGPPVAFPAPLVAQGLVVGGLVVGAPIPFGIGAPQPAPPAGPTRKTGSLDATNVRFKTELCRSWEAVGSCRYGAGCQVGGPCSESMARATC